MAYLPLFVDITEKKILVIGAGRAAAIKIRTLLDFEADFTVIAPEIGEEVMKLYDGENFEMQKRKFCPEDVKGCFIVIAAADGRTGQTAAEAAKREGCLYMAADGKGKGDIIFPAHKRQGDITVCAGTAGGYPLLGKKIVEKMDLSFADRLPFFSELRREVIESACEGKQELLKRLLEDDILYSPDYRQKAEAVLKEYIK